MARISYLWQLWLDGNLYFCLFKNETIKYHYEPHFDLKGVVNPRIWGKRNSNKKKTKKQQHMVAVAFLSKSSNLEIK